MAQSTTARYNIEALIVGAGPTDMVMVSELKRHGMQCRIIDRLLGTYQHVFRACLLTTAYNWFMAAFGDR